MFHSSGSRHEQYIIRSHKSSRATLHQKRSSLESEISGADSGYTSSSSTVTTTPIHQVIPKNITEPTVAVAVVINNPPLAKKKKSRRHQPPRQPDLVYSCPRPLAFPFHNDDHFLPIAEADPRDVARVSPSLNRSSSLQSSKTSIGSTRMFDSSGSARGLDTESSYSHQSSILSTIQRGTVRSIRSLFQLPESNKDLVRVQTNYTNDSEAQLHRLEIKKGTVQSIKDMFTKKRASIQTQHVTQLPPRQQKGQVGTTIGRFESSLSSHPKAKDSQPSVAIQINVTPPSPSKPKSFKTRASEFASKAFWSSNATTKDTKPLPKKPSESNDKKTFKSEVKKISARVFALPKKWSTTSNQDNRVSLPVPVTEAPKPKRSLFASFRRSDISASVDNLKKGAAIANTTATTTTTTTTTSTTTTDEITPPRTSTTVGKMWKSFKSLVTGKKPSRIGIL